MTALAPSSRTRRPTNTALHATGAVLVALSAGMAAAGAYEAIGDGGETVALLASAAITAAVGFLMWRGTALPRRISVASGFTAVAFTWVVASLAGALPFLLAGTFDHVDDALFESVSGFTTTASSLLGSSGGATDGLVLWRALLGWIGGMSAVLLAVAVLPWLGVGGLKIVRDEAPGPEDDRFASWVGLTGRRLALLYAGFTAVILGGMLAAGAGTFDAFTHAFGAVSTSGFSSRAGSVASFDSAAVELVLIVGMLAGATSFTLHRRAIRRHRDVYRHALQLRLFAAWLVAAVVTVGAINVADGASLTRGIRDAGFTVVSLATTTGFSTVDYTDWLPAAHVVVLLLLLVGAMTGSAAGGMKLIRLQVVFLYARRELRRARHPRGVFPLRMGHTTLGDPVMTLVAGFVALYLIAFLAGTLALAAFGSDLTTAFGASASALSNVGPGLGDVAPGGGFDAVSRPDRAVLDVLMVLGRIEIFPALLALAAPARVMSRRRRRRSAPPEKVRAA
ncbi:MAG TPA: TrkH family potassium uptake protein [Acidimicrobiia bacterium]|nr:TrkH family potassium uptake protein [Acidimicrobiia bacterium]